MVEEVLAGRGGVIQGALSGASMVASAIVKCRVLGDAGLRLRTWARLSIVCLL